MPSPWEKTLPDNHFNNAIRLVRRGSPETVAAIRQASFDTLKRLRVSRVHEKAIGKTPPGSDQVDTGSLVTWMNRIEAEDKEAIEQLIQIDATAVSRSA